MGTAVGKGVRPPQFAKAAVRRKGLPPGAAALRAEAPCPATPSSTARWRFSASMAAAKYCPALVASPLARYRRPAAVSTSGSWGASCSATWMADSA